MSKSEINQESKSEALNSPFSRVYLCPQTQQIINCAIGFKYPIDLEAFKKAFSNSIMIKHPRFCSLLVRNPNNGQDQWKRTLVNIDDHFIVHYPNSDFEEEEEGEELVNAYLANFALSHSLSLNKPLWEVHVLMGLKCVVLRVHHTLGDGVSLMSMLSNCFGHKKVTINGVNSYVNPTTKTTVKTTTQYNHTDISTDVNVIKNNHVKRTWKESKIWVSIMRLWFTIVFGFGLLWRLLWVKDKISVLSGGDGVELWPRTLVTAKFEIEDFKFIKMAVPNATVNDVLLGIISHGLSKYINAITAQATQQSIKVTAILMVNLRKKSRSQKQTSVKLTTVNSSCDFLSWGNKTGLVLLPIYCCNGLHPLDHVRTMKAIMDQKKQSNEAQISHWALNLITSFLGPKVGSWCSHRILCNTTLLISNIVGPSREIAIANNPASYIRVNISSSPHAMTMHMVSYAGKADLQLMVAKDIITNPELLAKCIKDSFSEMKNSIKSKPIV